MDLHTVPLDGLYKLLMEGASGVMQVEAAERLVFFVPTLRTWLIDNGFMRLHGEGAECYAATQFDEAIERLRELSLDGRQFGEFGPGKSERAVFYAAAALSGKASVGTLRNFMPDLEAEHARLVAEAMLYAAGYMDGAADPWANEIEGPGTGPNAAAYESRL